MRMMSIKKLLKLLCKEEKILKIQELKEMSWNFKWTLAWIILCKIYLCLCLSQIQGELDFLIAMYSLLF